LLGHVLHALALGDVQEDLRVLNLEPRPRAAAGESLEDGNIMGVQN
jgi:hypothetical protein